MGEAFITRRGGGANLNFRVNDYPTDTDLDQIVGKVNEIAVLTDTEMPDWQISFEEPENPEEGFVWVKAGTSSKHQIEALKKHSVLLNIQGVWQYDGEDWVRKKAFVWQNGEWNDLDVFVYDNGDQCTALTGGWGKYEYYGAVTFYDDHVNMALAPGGTLNIFTIGLVDFSGYTNLRIKYGNATNNNAYVWVGPSQSGPYAATATLSSGGSEATLDVSDYKDSELYIGVRIGNNGSIDVYEICLE